MASATLSLKVKVIEGKDLLAKDKNGLSDPYVKLSVPPQKHRTTVKSATLRPQWNEEFTFVNMQTDSELRLRIFDHDKFSKDDFMGAYHFPASELLKIKASGQAADLWLQLKNKKGEHDQERGTLHVKLEWSA
ncbi:Multiple C2 and transmembrane domain-containing protein [Balamuthia mandrillaris]